MFGDPTLGDAILDLIVHNAHRIELKLDLNSAGLILASRG